MADYINIKTGDYKESVDGVALGLSDDWKIVGGEKGGKPQSERRAEINAQRQIVRTVPKQYRKVNKGKIVEMTAQEKAAVDAAKPRAGVSMLNAEPAVKALVDLLVSEGVITLNDYYNEVEGR